MANPYHDATGRFCSKGEMITAIKEAAEAGNLDQYFELRRDYENIEQGKVEISQTTLNKVMNSGLVLNELTSDDIEVAFEAIDIDKNHGVSKLISFIENPEVPADVMERIYDLPIEQKENLLKALGRNWRSHEERVPPEFYLNFVKPEESTDVTSHYLGMSRMLTFEQKVNLLRESPSSFANFIEGSPSEKNFLSSPELRQEFLEDVNKKTADPNVSSEVKDNMLYKLSRYSDREAQAVVFEKTIQMYEDTGRAVPYSYSYEDLSPLHSLMSNEKVDPKLLARTASWMQENAEATCHIDVYKEAYHNLLTSTKGSIPPWAIGSSLRKGSPSPELEQKYIKASKILKDESGTMLDQSRAQSIVSDYYSYTDTQTSLNKQRAALTKPYKKLKRELAKLEKSVYGNYEERKAVRAQIEQLTIEDTRLRSSIHSGAWYAQKAWYTSELNRIADTLN